MTNNSVMKYEVKAITPALARQYLEGQMKNRKWRRDVVDRYKSEMIAEKWAINGQPIIFDKDGHLVDGQHRLMALIEANKVVKMLMVTGVDPNVIKTIDMGKSRTVGDVFQMSGIRNAKLLARTSKMLFIWNNKFPELIQKKMFTKEIMNVPSQTIFDYYLQNKVYIDRACSEFKRHSDIITGAGAAVLSFVFAVLEKIELDRCYAFITSFVSGHIKKEWTYMIMVREAMITRNTKIRLTEGERISIIFGLWNVIYNKVPQEEVERNSLNIPSELLKK